VQLRVSLAARNYQKETMKDNTSTLQHEEVLRHPIKSGDLPSDQKPSQWVRQIMKEARRNG